MLPAFKITKKLIKKRKKTTINNSLRSCQKLQREEKEILSPMPGCIQVSVLGLMDLSLSPPLCSLSLTVSMGKREYRTVGSGELSLPVVSLREDLTVMVHNAEGEEILRTEFKTMILLERGLWDNLIPLKNGGCLHMKLQFLLSEEDRKRIREMRDSALKRRCMEKPRTRHRRSFSDNRVGCSPTRSIADPIVESYFHQTEKLPPKRIGMGVFPKSATIEEGDTSNLSSPQTMPKSFSLGMLSELSSQRQPKLVKESFLLKKMTQNAIPAMHCEALGNRDLKCDEKIHKLDIGTEESKETNNKNSEVAPLYSEKSGSSLTIDNDPKAADSGKATRLAVGIFSERKDFAFVDVEKGPSIIPIIRNFETVREKGNLNLTQKGGGGLSSNATSGTLKERPLWHGSAELATVDGEHDIVGKKRDTRNMIGDGNAASSEGANRKIKKVDVDKNINEEPNLRNKSLPLKKIVDDLEDIKLSCQQGMLGEVARTGGDENRSERPLNKQTASVEHSTAGKKHYSRIWSAHGYATSSEGANKKIEAAENNNEERSFGDETLPYQERFSVEVAKTVNDENTLESHSNERVAPGSLYEKVEALNSGCSSVCPIGILGTWTSRHLCITTGSKLLREFAESCTVSLETNSIESSSMREADTKQQKDRDAYVQGIESMVLPSPENPCFESSPSSLESNGGLIEQGVWIVVIIVACGLLLKGV